jgi:hypothetical protein
MVSNLTKQLPNLNLSIIRVKKLAFFVIIGGLVCWIFSSPLLSLELHELVARAFEHVPFNRQLRVFLAERLTKVDTSPNTTRGSYQESKTVIYVMGGSEESLNHRFKIAADLYHLGLSKRILLLSREGITHYDPSLGRNLTNDEWSVRRLVDFEVKREDIEPIVLRRRYFGTFTEAKVISDIVLKRGYKNLILVTSSCHTMRTWLSFSKVLKDKPATLHIYGPSDPISLLDLLREYFKLFIYRNFVLPIYHPAKKLN